MDPIVQNVLQHASQTSYLLKGQWTEHLPQEHHTILTLLTQSPSEVVVPIEM